MSVYLIGIGGDGKQSLGPKALSIINQAGLLVGDKNLIDLFNTKSETFVIKASVDEAIDKITSDLGKNVVVLTKGDPLFHDIGRHVLEKIPKESVVIIPSPSLMQIAFSLIKESWEDAVFVSLSNKSMEAIIQLLRHTDKIGIYTTTEITPNAIAEELGRHGMSDITMFVLENIGQENERITSGTIFQIAADKFSFPNTVILSRTSAVGERGRLELGIPDHEFYQRGQVTPWEVRSISISKLGLTEKSILWVIGAGCGETAIEACYIVRRGGVYAMENNNANFECLKRNIDKFRTQNLRTIQGIIPECLDAIFEDPDSIFFGTTDLKVLQSALDRLRNNGRFVMSTNSLEELNKVTTWLQNQKYRAQVVLVSISRLNITQLKPLDPVWIVYGFKPTR